MMTIYDTGRSVTSYSATNELRGELTTLTDELRAHAEGLDDATRSGELDRRNQSDPRLTCGVSVLVSGV